jgi:hypothetical protein
MVRKGLERIYQRISYRKVHSIAIDELYLGTGTLIYHAGDRSGKRADHGKSQRYPVTPSRGGNPASKCQGGP